MAKPLRRSQKRRQAQQNRNRSSQTNVAEQAVPEKVQIYSGFEPLHFALPHKRSELSAIERELLGVLDSPDFPDFDIDLHPFWVQEHQRFLQSDLVKRQVISRALTHVLICDKLAFEVVEPLKTGLIIRPLEELVRFANEVMHLYGPDSAYSDDARKRRVAFFGLVQQTLCKNCLVVMERYHLLDDNPDFQVCCCWLQMLADQALDRILLRCLYAFEHMLDQDKDLWDSFRREKRAINFDLSVMVSTCLLYEKVKTAKEKLLAVAPDRAAAEAQLWFQPIPLSSIPETSSELKAREYLDLD